MLQDENEQNLGSTAAPSAGQHLDSAPMPGQGTESDLTAITSENVPAIPVSPRREKTPFSGNKREIKNYFVVQNWHRPYARALLEDDRIKLPLLITVAEREILHRYLELADSVSRTEECLDLQRAVKVLSQRRRSNAIESMRQHFVA